MHLLWERVASCQRHVLVHPGRRSMKATKASARLLSLSTCIQAASSVPVHHTFGNHCLCLPRDMMLHRLGMPASFYAVNIAPGWRLLVLDTTQMSGHSGYPEVSFFPSLSSHLGIASVLKALSVGDGSPRGFAWFLTGAIHLLTVLRNQCQCSSKAIRSKSCQQAHH